VEPGQPKKFGAMFFEDFLRLLGGLDHFLAVVSFKARELHDPHTEFLPHFACCPWMSGLKGALARNAMFFSLPAQAQPGKLMSGPVIAADDFAPPTLRANTPGT
jgi:hypothetical protein